ncbi:MAG: hypothetical protein HKM89_10575 [Gemmatimonadales bacterium]|nr:hypothetical protein [Gemmatimonadales bacterium]
MRPHRGWPVAFFVAVMACGQPGPRPIRYGEELCEYCRMTITDPRFAAQLVTRKGRILTFDDIGGLVAFVNEERIPPAEVHSLWVNSFTQPEIQLDATTAHFLQSDRLRTPMGSQLAAFLPGREIERHKSELGGEVLRWGEVLALPAHSVDDESPGDEDPGLRP